MKSHLTKQRPGWNTCYVPLISWLLAITRGCRYREKLCWQSFAYTMAAMASGTYPCTECFGGKGTRTFLIASTLIWHTCPPWMHSGSFPEPSNKFEREEEECSMVQGKFFPLNHRTQLPE